MKLRFGLFSLVALATAVSPVLAQPDANADPAQRQAYFGEMHLHTYLSFDAWTFGTRVTPDQAYKFGRGETVMVPAVQIGREEGNKAEGDVAATRAWPLDFMAVTDHSEFMGGISQLGDPNSEFSKSQMGKDLVANPRAAFFKLAKDLHAKPTPPELVQAAEASHAWDIVMKAVQDNYEPGKFTTLLAYEWTSSSQEGGNLHRNVFFNSDHAPRPFTSSDSTNPEDLWDYMDSVRKQGIDVISIPHNGNASNGAMYDWNTNTGRPIDEAYAQRRAFNEPLTEIVQTKGQSDTVPSLSPNDEFANFEIYDHFIAQPGRVSKAPGSYVRDAFGRGLVIQAKVGANPYKYGVVGASDIHNGLSASDENAWAGGAWGLDPKTMLPDEQSAKKILGLAGPPERLEASPAEAAEAAAATGSTPPAPAPEAAASDRPVRGTPLENSSAGITGVWADHNDRASIFAALKRKETFATSGVRIRVRMFAGWDYDPKLMTKANWVSVAYAKGVPMGSDLPAMPLEASAPRFLLQAIKDPDGANLDRIQVIKLWLEGGTYKEKIFDVALSDGRKVDPKTGKAPPVGTTVDIANGTFTNAIGAAELKTIWRDPEFDAAKPAVYYARVLQIPTPRWSTLLAAKYHLPAPTMVDAAIQERAWSSPIWFTPPHSR
jgi:Protein of unknown function (DUF3604)